MKESGANMAKIKKSVLTIEPLSYASSEAPEAELLDLRDGINPYGFDPAVLENANLKDPALWTSYPHNQEELRALIAERWGLSPTQVILTAGSIDGIYKINSLFDPELGGVVGISPQFSEYITHAKQLGFSYNGIPVKEEEGYHLPLSTVCDAIDDTTALVYLDHPHNPTGQSIPLDEFEKILTKAKIHDACVIADEAYGDYLAPEESAAMLLSKYENLFVIRSFSKGRGLPGARMGYVLTSPYLAGLLESMGHPYTVPGAVGEVIKKEIANEAHLQESIRLVTATKAKLHEHLGEKMQMAPTAPTVPICMLIAKDRTLHLGEAFLKQGVRTVYGESYYGLGKHCVRLHIPHEKDEERLWEVLEALNRE